VTSNSCHIKYLYRLINAATTMKQKLAWFPSNVFVVANHVYRYYYPQLLRVQKMLTFTICN
jgi:hypothetical protein